MIPLLLIAAAVALLVLAVMRGRDSARRPPPAAVGVRPAPTRRVREDVPHLLYRYVWLSGLDAYYGISNEPPERHGRHLTDPRDRWWIEQSTKVMHPVRWYPNRTEARLAERAAIRHAVWHGAYLANDHHNPRRRPRAVTR